MVKNPPSSAEDIRDMGSISGLGRSPWRRAWQPTPVFLPGESHGERSLAVYSLWNRKMSNMTEAMWHAWHATDSLFCTAEMNTTV